MIAKKFVLPKDHDWVYVTVDSTHNDYKCEVCGATWSHDITDDSIEQDEGDGSCNK